MKNYAYITFLSSDNYFYYILALYDSFKETKSAYPLYCCVTEDVSEKTLDMFDKIGLEYIKVSTNDFANIINQSSKNKAPKKYIRALGKLSIFTLTQFSKCVYLDSDLIIKQNIDDLFDKPAFTAVEDCLPVHKRPNKYILGESSFNSGMFVYEPSMEYYNTILEIIPTLNPSIKWHDQAILSYLNQDWMQREELHLPYTYNTLVAQQEDVLGEIRRQKLSLDDVKVYHYVTYKNAPYSTSTALYENVYLEYYEYFEYINKLIDKYDVDLEKTHMENIVCKTMGGKRCVDLVVPYVDSSDPEWIKLFNEYSPKTGEEAVDAPNRFRGNTDIFRYFFRCVEKNMPWIHKIHLLVQSETQVPKWINRDVVHVVYHEDFIPKEYLPTFNSCTIEMFLWNIPGLSEEFLYANDDFYVLKPTSVGDFFSGNKVKFNFNFFRKHKDTNIYINHTINARTVVDGKEYDEGFLLEHVFKPYHKSRVLECFSKYREDLLSRLTQFRDGKNTNCYLFNYYDYVNGYRLESSIKYKYCTLHAASYCAQVIRDKEFGTIVINDNCLDNPSETIYTKIIDAFKKDFHFISKYEFIDESQIPQDYLDRINKVVKKVPDSLQKTLKSTLLKNYIP